MQPNLEQTLILESSSVSLKLSLLNSMALKVRLQGLSPAALLKSQLANARLTKPLTICAGAVAQSVEFTSLTGLPEVQRLSETVREDARSGQRYLLRVIFEKNLVFSGRFAETCLPTGYSFVRAWVSALRGERSRGPQNLTPTTPMDYNSIGVPRRWQPYPAPWATPGGY